MDVPRGSWNFRVHPETAVLPPLVIVYWSVLPVPQLLTVWKLAWMTSLESAATLADAALGSGAAVGTLAAPPSCVRTTAVMAPATASGATQSRARRRERRLRACRIANLPPDGNCPVASVSHLGTWCALGQATCISGRRAVAFLSMDARRPYRFGNLLALARKSWIEQVGERVQEAGFPGYRRSDAAVLAYLLPRPLAIGQLGEALAERGYASFGTDEADARRTLVILTPRGKSYGRAIWTAQDALNETVRSRVSEADLAAADAVLRAVFPDDGARQREDKRMPLSESPLSGREAGHADQYQAGERREGESGYRYGPPVTRPACPRPG